MDRQPIKQLAIAVAGYVTRRDERRGMVQKALSQRKNFSNEYPGKRSVSQARQFLCAFAAIRASLQAVDNTGTDYALDRIQRLEEKLATLKEEQRTKGSAATPDGRPY